MDSNRDFSDLEILGQNLRILKGLYKDPYKNLSDIVEVEPEVRKSFSGDWFFCDDAICEVDALLTEYDCMKRECSHPIALETYAINIVNSRPSDAYFEAIADVVHKKYNIRANERSSFWKGKFEVILAGSSNVDEIDVLLKRNFRDGDLVIVSSDHPAVSKLDEEGLLVDKLDPMFENDICRHYVSLPFLSDRQRLDFGFHIYRRAQQYSSELLKNLWLHNRVHLICRPEDVYSRVIQTKLDCADRTFVVALPE